MFEFERPIVLRSPHERGQRVRDAQWTLKHNFFGVDFLKEEVDGDWGLISGQGADNARYWLGYPKGLCESRVFGQQLYNYLRRDGRRTKLPLTYLARRKARLRLANESVKQKALRLAASQIGYTESPPGSNRSFAGSWYGLNGEPWCAMFITWAYCTAGDTKVFRKGSRSAYAYWSEYAARAGQYGLRVTANPEPGDIVVYHHRDGHTGIFEKWTDRRTGDFTAVEGNTSASSDDNGGAVERRRRNTRWVPTVFVRFPG